MELNSLYPLPSEDGVNLVIFPKTRVREGDNNNFTKEKSGKRYFNW